MTLQITDATLEGFKPGNDSDISDYEIPGDDIYSFDVEQKVGGLKDTGKLAIDNYQDQYSEVIDHDDRIVVSVFGPDIAGLSTFGGGGFGSNTFGGSGDSIVWTGLVRSYERSYLGASQSNLTADAEDFVSAIMGYRRVYNSFRDRQIVGSNGIVNEILQDNCPEIDRSLLPDRPETTSMTVFGEYVLDVIAELASRLPAVMATTGTSLRFDHPSTLSPQFTLETADIGVPTLGSQDENVRNSVRVRGGTAPALDDEQLTQDGTTTVTDSSFATQRIDTRKSYVEEIDLYTVADRTGEDIIIRLQKDDGGAPIEPTNEESDVAKTRLSAEFLDDNGFTLFDMPTETENILPEPRPWMIVQTDGSNGQDIGIDTATGNLAYKSYYPYPVVLERQLPDSPYRERDGEVVKRSLATFPEVRDRANSFLNANGAPTETMKMDAESVRMHTHDIGESVQVDDDETGVQGAFVAMEKKDHYEENQLTTDFSLQSLASI